ncbi:MAG TPA: hypothetical protein VGI40_26155 [Pirellulaceae bacterium]
MKFTTLIPTRFNDGKRVPTRQMRAFLQGFARQFGGCSNEGLTLGQWIDPKDSIHYRDESQRVTVVCDRIMLDEAKAAVIRIGVELRQRAMYFEVRDYDGVQFLEMPLS